MSVDGDLLASIRLRAYYLWEQADRPSGGDIEFWDEARRQIEAEAPQPAPAPSAGPA